MEFSSGKGINIDDWRAYYHITSYIYFNMTYYDRDNKLSHLSFYVFSSIFLFSFMICSFVIKRYYFLFHHHYHFIFFIIIIILLAKILKFTSGLYSFHENLTLL